MSNSFETMIAAVSVLVKMGYKVTLEAQPIGKVGTGVFLHVIDEDKQGNK